MLFRTQRTLSENILMIFYPFRSNLCLKKNCWFVPKISLFSVVNCSGTKNVVKHFPCTKKCPRMGQDINFLFFKKYSKDGKSNFGISGTIIAQNRFFWKIIGQVSDRQRWVEGGGGIVPWSCPLRHTFC